MPSTGLNGPFTLTNAGVNEAVRYKSAGAYALGHTDRDSNFYVEYVGRDDVSVHQRLKSWVGQQFAQFKFAYFASPKGAFEKECQLYHDFPNRNNKIHPARPDGANWKCPFCQAFD